MLWLTVGIVFAIIIVLSNVLHLAVDRNTDDQRSPACWRHAARCQAQRWLLTARTHTPTIHTIGIRLAKPLLFSIFLSLLGSNVVLYVFLFLCFCFLCAARCVFFLSRAVARDCGQRSSRIWRIRRMSFSKHLALKTSGRCASNSIRGPRWSL